MQHTPKKEAIMMARIEEACEHNYEPHFFDFCDGAMFRKLTPILNKQKANFCFWGGTENAERKMLCIFPEYMNKEDLEWPMMAFRFQAKFPIDHRNVLGEMMALGITRECLGDIHAGEGEVQVIFVSRLKVFFEENIKRMKGHPIKLQWFSSNEIKTYEKAYKSLSIVAASNRVDGIIGKIWGFSRQDALTYIKQGRLKVNDEEITKNDFRLSAGDILSIRGKGKALISEVDEGRTKKGNMRILIKKYIS